MLVCSAFSVVDSLAKAYLEVTAMEDEPPPIIRAGPANQTLPVNTLAILQCEASGSPQPSIILDERLSAYFSHLV